MELPDFMNYSSKFTQKDFVEKISRIAKRAGSKLVYAALILYYTLQSDKVSKADKAIIIGALGYMISPLDVIPDAIPIAGLTDDLAVLLYVLKKVWTGIDPEIIAKARERLSKWFDEEEINEKDKRTVLRLHPTLAPFKAAVLPLSKKLGDKATEVFDSLAKDFMVDYDDAGSIGKRYRRQDEIGTPVCITYDFDSLEDNCVTIRNRDTMEQERIAIDKLHDYITELVKF